MRWRAHAAVVLVLTLVGCTPAPSGLTSSEASTSSQPSEGQIVGGHGDLHVAPDGGMLFCVSPVDPGFTGSWRECGDGIRTEGVDPAAIDATRGDTGTADPGGHRWVGAAEGRRTLDDGTHVYTVFLAGTRTDDSFTVTSVGTDKYKIPLEYQELRPGTPGGFLVRVVPIG